MPLPLYRPRTCREVRRYPVGAGLGQGEDTDMREKRGCMNELSMSEGGEHRKGQGGKATGTEKKV